MPRITKEVRELLNANISRVRQEKEAAIKSELQMDDINEQAAGDYITEEVMPKLNDIGMTYGEYVEWQGNYRKLERLDLDRADRPYNYHRWVDERVEKIVAESDVGDRIEALRREAADLKLAVGTSDKVEDVADRLRAFGVHVG
jgi:hypothetical protein